MIKILINELYIQFRCHCQQYNAKDVSSFLPVYISISLKFVFILRYVTKGKKTEETREKKKKNRNHDRHSYLFPFD
jgi:hypothetical protein